MTDGRASRRNTWVVVTAVLALLLVGGWVLLDKLATSERATAAEETKQVVEGQRDAAAADAKQLGEQVVTEVCASNDPADQARFRGLCELARQNAERTTGPPGERGLKGDKGDRGVAGPEPACNALPTRCVGPEGPPGIDGKGTCPDGEVREPYLYLDGRFGSRCVQPVAPLAHS